jgi:hypothetical protein
MGEWRFDGIGGRVSIWAAGFFVSSLAFAAAAAALLAGVLDG